MKANLIEDLSIAEAKASIAGQRVIGYAKAIANGTPKSNSSDDSNIFWKRWKAGDKNAMDMYVKSNVWLFAQIAFKLKAKYYTMDLEDIFSIVVGFTQEAFEGYSNKRKATLISYHSHYAQYRVSHTFEAMSPLSYKQRKLLREARRVAFNEGVSLQLSLAEMLKSRNMYKYKGAAQTASKIIGLSKGMVSLDRSITLERDSITLGDTMQAPKEDIDAPLDIKANRRQIERIKQYISKDLNSAEKEMFLRMIEGVDYKSLAREKGTTTQNIHYIQKSVKRKLAFRAKQLKAKGIALPEQF